MKNPHPNKKIIFSIARIVEKNNIFSYHVDDLTFAFKEPFREHKNVGGIAFNFPIR